MGFGALRSMIRPVSRALSPASHFSPAARTFSTIPPPQLRHLSAPLRRCIPWIPPRSAFHSLTDARYPKRRPEDKPRRKRASLKPPGPYAWVKCVHGETILPNQPNQGSVKRRNEKNRIKQHRAFIKSSMRLGSRTYWCRTEKHTFPGVVGKKDTQGSGAGGQVEEAHPKGGEKNGCSCKRQSLGRKSNSNGSKRRSIKQL